LTLSFWRLRSLPLHKGFLNFTLVKALESKNIEIGEKDGSWKHEARSIFQNAKCKVKSQNENMG
jgi:hypothetical protein